MEIKYRKPLLTYKYLVMFDLASHTTGVCLWDIAKHAPVSTGIIKTNTVFKVDSLYNELALYFNQLNALGINNSDIIVYKEAMPSQLRGGSSTIQTFVALAKSHAILTLFLLQNGIDFYDDIGIYPATTRANFKRLCPGDASSGKDGVRDYVRSLYSLPDISLDESDAVFLAMTFVDVKWNNDIDSEIRDIKRHARTLVLDHAKRECDEKIKRLVELKIG